MPKQKLVLKNGHLTPVDNKRTEFLPPGGGKVAPW